ncbi:MAG: MTAP family purine nucleoside phosphorylase [Candidatus Thermoplasmatota archaeon]|nr:MTAP family purine nucleoside phosphorylase [Candidatus Thermoplasmatota archaeon]MBU1940867.1 MTAP family purine nucleoside phosphorylase [Candidatus Thermoplasmatota archaeon]
MKVGLISGRKVPKFLSKCEEMRVDTEYGSITVKVAEVGGHSVFFINRHGGEGDLPPHQVNYRGNIQALVASHVSCVLGIGTVGSLNLMIQPGDVVLPHDFVDMTKRRVYSFFDTGRVHVDLTVPFCPFLRSRVLERCRTMKGMSVHESGVYVVTEGPRLETPAEIRMYQTYGDIVGMTLVPEVVLARERGLCYASICVVCNMAAGMQASLSADEIIQVFNEKKSMVSSVLEDTIQSLDAQRTCQCHRAIDKASL